MKNNELREEIDNAIENYKSNKEFGSPSESLAFDAGRIDGLKRSLEIIENVFQEVIE